MHEASNEGPPVREASSDGRHSGASRDGCQSAVPASTRVNPVAGPQQRGCQVRGPHEGLQSGAAGECPHTRSITKRGEPEEVLGILVSLQSQGQTSGCSRGGDVSVELPFVLMHPKPSDLPISRPQSVVPETYAPVGSNLIEFETNNFSQDDDFVFEDFARLRLKGTKDDEDDHLC
nr:arrestin red cell-like [Salvelinus alpinus]